jgi:transcriptional regulator with XRE-family HTH domain
MADFYEYSTPEIVQMLGSRFKDYRMRCDLTQKEVADKSGIGLTTIHKFENGTAGNLSLSTFILLLKVVGQVNALDDILPELPPSPYLMRSEEKKAQRIRHTKRQ